MYFIGNKWFDFVEVGVFGEGEVFKNKWFDFVVVGIFGEEEFFKVGYDGFNGIIGLLW